ncbi:MAG: aminoacyl-tRNA hydrolase [Vicingaceae bacterium]
MKYLIAGLGNIGSEYQHTRHNVGFEILDCYAKRSGIFFADARYGAIAKARYRGRQLILLKPSTYMNLSGKAVRYWMEQEKIPLERLLVLTDDIALPFGKIRIRGKGSDGGHNGLKSINDLLDSAQYARLRFGIGDDFHKGSQVNYVLDKWSEVEESTLGERLEICADAINAFAYLGLGKTMTEFNSK